MTRRARVVAWGTILALFVWSAWATEVSLVRSIEGVPFVLDFLRRMVPPDFSVLEHALRGAAQTFQIAIVGTGIAAVLALPLGFLAARNVSPPWLFYVARSVLNVFRAVDTLVYALIFVAAVGLGPFPGMLAVVAYTATVLAKLYSEAIDGECYHSSCRSSSPSPSTASRPISAPRPFWGSSGQGASAFISRPTSACSTIRQPPLCLWSSSGSSWRWTSHRPACVRGSSRKRKGPGGLPPGPRVKRGTCLPTS